MARSEKIFIPEEAKRPKPDYPHRESANRARTEIRQWVKAGNLPCLWRGHTHTKPPPGSVPTYIMEVDLPESMVKANRLSPCPCCTPEYPKYGKGYVAWFEDEHVIRIIGRHCFRKINPEFHDAAVERLKREKRRELDDALLLQRLPEVPRYLRELYRAGNLAQLLDHLRLKVRKHLEAHGIDLWRHIWRGVLTVNPEQRETEITPNGSPYTRTVRVERKFADFAGEALFMPNPPRQVIAVQTAIFELKRVEFIGPTKHYIAKLDNASAMRLANKTRKALRLAHDHEAEASREPVALYTAKRTL